MVDEPEPDEEPEPMDPLLPEVLLPVEEPLWSWLFLCFLCLVVV